MLKFWRPDYIMLTPMVRVPKTMTLKTPLTLMIRFTTSLSLPTILYQGMIRKLMRLERMDLYMLMNKT